MGSASAWIDGIETHDCFSMSEYMAIDQLPEPIAGGTHSCWAPGESGERHPA